MERISDPRQLRADGTRFEILGETRLESHAARFNWSQTESRTGHETGLLIYIVRRFLPARYFA